VLNFPHVKEAKRKLCSLRRKAVIQTREELEREVIAQYHELGRALKATSGPVWMEIDLTIAQLRTLLVLAEDGPLVIGQIAQRLGIGLSTGGHLVDRLVQADLAERTEDPEDRRRTLAQLTPKGEDLYARLLTHPQRMQTLILKLGEDDLAALLQGLRALNRLVEEGH
jgi:MarR family transcriptional regulator, organic hydroperoxide resistance regulator